MSEKLNPVFTPPHEKWSCTTNELSRSVRNLQPTMTDDPSVETSFKQELNNPSVRNRTYPEGTEKGEEMFVDLVMQLNAAQQAAIHFENEARINKTDSDMWYQYYLDAIKVRRELQVENDKLKAGGFWKRVGEFFTGHQTIGDI